MAEMESGQPANGGISRRTVAKGMAWAVPAMAVAATVPFAAASCVPTVGLAPGSCKKANVNSYYLLFNLSGDPTCDAPITCTGETYALRYKGNQNIFWGSTDNPEPVPFAAGITVCGMQANANYIQAYVSVSCINGGEPFWTGDIGMPQVSTGKCTDPTFCSTS